jgi:hypothetical protein
MLLKEFGPYGITFINVCVVITVDMALFLRNFVPYEIMLMPMCVYFLILSRHS